MTSKEKLFAQYRRILHFIQLAHVAKEMPEGTLWAVGIMEDGPFARLVLPQPNGGYTGGYVEAYADTPAEAVKAALDKAALDAPIVYQRGFGPGDGDSRVIDGGAI